MLWAHLKIVNLNEYTNYNLEIMKKRVRLYNFLIDSALFFVIVLIFSALFKDVVAEEHLKYIMIPMYCLYYFIMEWTTGQTVGKMITKSKVVKCDSDGAPSISSILIRTLCRLIPLDFFTYLFIPKGIHDKVSNTELKQF